MVLTTTTQAVPTPAGDGKQLLELDPSLIPNLDDLVTEDGAPKLIFGKIRPSG